MIFNGATVLCTRFRFLTYYFVRVTAALLEYQTATATIKLEHFV